MSEQIEVRVTAIGSTDAADKAKRWARGEGYRVQTVAAIRLTGEHRDGCGPDPCTCMCHPKNEHREPGPWTVTLAVRSLA